MFCGIKPSFSFFGNQACSKCQFWDLLNRIEPVVNVIKLFLVEIQKIQISPLAETARIGHSNKQFQSIALLKIALFSHFCAGSDIRTYFLQFLNFGENQITSKKKFYNIDHWAHGNQAFFLQACSNPPKSKHKAQDLIT